jgi:CubicO group peptidase (beta-lactamase class C family)
VLGQHPATTPGTRFTYSSDGSHLLSAILADATGQPTLRYTQAKLFGPLGIASDHPFQLLFAPATRRPTSGPASPGRPTRRATTSATGS